MGTSDSGQGTRPTTAGGVDNIGGADAFIPGKGPDKGNVAPGPPEKMTEKRQDGSSSRADHPAPQSTD